MQRKLHTKNVCIVNTAIAPKKHKKQLENFICNIIIKHENRTSNHKFYLLTSKSFLQDNIKENVTKRRRMLIDNLVNQFFLT